MASNEIRRRFCSVHDWGKEYEWTSCFNTKDKDDTSSHINCVAMLSFVRCYDRFSYLNKPAWHLIIVDIRSEDSWWMLVSTFPCFQLLSVCMFFVWSICPTAAISLAVLIYITRTIITAQLSTVNASMKTYCKLSTQWHSYQIQIVHSSR